ncbi:MAG: hypothetical protein GTO24_24880, partial [candidate division Zixibacteria bacterium]|nr:hypothetical protein [candidate division Zixibacteria bacterium]
MLGVPRYQGHFLSALGFFLLVTLGTPYLNAEAQPMKGKPALPGAGCQTDPLDSWTPQEKWAWEQVCQEKIADFNKAEDYGGVLHPKEVEKWPEGRILRFAFLETILLHEPYRGALPRYGVRIRGAWFKESLHLEYAALSHMLRLDTCRFESDVNLSSLKAHRLLSFDGSKFTGKLNMNGMEAAGS